MALVCLMMVLLLAPFTARAEATPVSETTATRLSLFGAVVPAATGIVIAATDDDALEGPGGEVMWSGVLVGPSVGHFYARRPARALFGIGVRAAGFAISEWGADEFDGAGQELFVTLGIGLVFASMFADISGAKKSARKHNAAVADRGVTVVPSVYAVRQGAGAAVRVAF